MTFSEELGLLIRARYPLVYVPTREEERAAETIGNVAVQTGSRTE